MSERTCLAVVLAAGDGTRMKSARSKVLHPIAHRPMVLHVVDALRSSGVGNVALVVGKDADRVAEAVHAEAEASGLTLSVHEQTERLGTAHAALAARHAISRGFDDVLIVFGDTPLIEAETLLKARAAIADGAGVAVIGFQTGEPTGYGRLILGDSGELVAIREEKDASEAERLIRLCNGGAMAIDGGRALDLLSAIGNDNAKGEYYLTDIVEGLRAQGGKAVAIEAAFEESLGVNTRLELSEAEAIWQKRRRRRFLLDGVGMSAPETVHLAHDTTIAADVQIEPNVVFGPGVSVEAGAVIRAFSHIEGATIGTRAEVGPFARLRPGAELRDKAKVGNFCEVKKAEVGPGAKVNHLTYIGDAHIGAGANIGAGTITCNYDGDNKHRTIIGEGVFVGSNSSLVAPVTLGAGSYIASGSVITADVGEDALAIGRARQTEKPGRAAEIRQRNAALKASSKKV